jgi:hypothetical protein
MKCAEPTKPHRKSGMWGTHDSLTIRILKREDRYWFMVRVNVCE